MQQMHALQKLQKIDLGKNNRRSAFQQLQSPLKPQKLVDIKKGIFRLVRKFWKLYKKSDCQVFTFKMRFKEYLAKLKIKEEEELQNIIVLFDKCKTRIKVLEIEEKDLIWGVCYSFNADKAKRFLENRWLSFMFLIAAQFIPKENYSEEFNSLFR